MSTRGLSRLLRVCIFIVLLCPAACQAKNATHSISLKNADGSRTPEIEVEIVNDEGNRRVGLMYRKSMPQQAGMLFIFPDEQPRSFWMKNTFIPLDIIFLDKDLKVVSISQRATPQSTVGLKSSSPAQYVLELNAGLAEKWGIRAGSLLLPEGQLPAAKN